MVIIIFGLCYNQIYTLNSLKSDENSFETSNFEISNFEVCMDFKEYPQNDQKYSKI